MSVCARLRKELRNLCTCVELFEEVLNLGPLLIPPDTAFAKKLFQCTSTATSKMYSFCILKFPTGKKKKKKKKRETGPLILSVCMETRHTGKLACASKQDINVTHGLAKSNNGKINNFTIMTMKEICLWGFHQKLSSSGKSLDEKQYPSCMYNTCQPSVCLGAVQRLAHHACVVYPPFAWKSLVKSKQAQYMVSEMKHFCPLH